MIVQSLIVINAFETWREYKENKSLVEDISNQSNLSNASQSLDEEENVESITIIDEQATTFLDFAKVKNNGKFSDRIVDDVKSLRSDFIVFSLLILYWLIQNQVKLIKFKNLRIFFSFIRVFLHNVNT